MKKILFGLIFIFLNTLLLSGQTMIVSGGMKLMPMNAYAAYNQEVDQFGEICGVLIIHCIGNSIKFNGEGIVNIEQKGSDYYLHLSPQSTSILMEYGQNEILKIPLEQIESKHTYELTISEKGRYGTLKLETIPTGCLINAYIDGETISLGKSPIRKPIELREGNYQVIISKDNYIPTSIDVRIINGQTNDLGKIKLQLNNTL